MVSSPRFIWKNSEYKSKLSNISVAIKKRINKEVRMQDIPVMNTLQRYSSLLSKSFKPISILKYRKENNIKRHNK
jgi:hypothetical protein